MKLAVANFGIREKLSQIVHKSCERLVIKCRAGDSFKESAKKGMVFGISAATPNRLNEPRGPR